jgi:hypothetical protein
VGNVQQTERLANPEERRLDVPSDPTSPSPTHIMELFLEQNQRLNGQFIDRFAAQDARITALTTENARLWTTVQLVGENQKQLGSMLSITRGAIFGGGAVLLVVGFFSANLLIICLCMCFTMWWFLRSRN